MSRSEKAPRGPVRSPAVSYKIRSKIRSKEEITADWLGGHYALSDLQSVVRMRGLEPPLPCEN